MEVTGSRVVKRGQCSTDKITLCAHHENVAATYSLVLTVILYNCATPTWGYFVLTTCPIEFNKFNSSHPPNWCCTILKVSVNRRGHFDATYPWDMYPQHFHEWAHVVILSLLHIASMCTAQEFCCCNLSHKQHEPSCLSSFTQ